MAAPTEDWWPGAVLSLRGPCAWFPCPQLVCEGLAPPGLQGRGFPPATAGSSRGSASPSGAFSFPTPGGSQLPQHHALVTRVGSVPARLAEMRVSSARLPLLAPVSLRSATLVRQPFFSRTTVCITLYPSLRITACPHQGHSTGLCRLRTAQPHLVVVPPSGIWKPSGRGTSLSLQMQF